MCFNSDREVVTRVVIQKSFVDHFAHALDFFLHYRGNPL